ncbi:rRNA maturation RNase YbeY [Chloroflexota bacterium]
MENLKASVIIFPEKIYIMGIMGIPEIQIRIDKPFGKLLNIKWLAFIIRVTLAAEAAVDSIEIGLLITDQGMVQRLNRDFRGLNEPTDVLAFSLTESDRDEHPFPPPPDGVVRLGEVIISYPQAKEQAAEHRHSIKQELALLIIHGVLHLLGYDHEDLEDKARMQGREREILECIFEEDHQVH